MAISYSNRNKVLSVFGLIMINVIAVDSLRSLPISAEYGFSLVFYYLIGGLFFLIPVALVAAELATGWPEAGGIYVWVRTAFGKRWGFLVIWFQWLYNIVWFPTIMSLLAATIAYLFEPSLATNKWYIWTTVVILFWAATLANWFGMKLSSLLSTIATLIGTLLPIIFIVILGVIWFLQGHPIAIKPSWHSFLPDLSHINHLALLSSVLFGLLGLEMSAVHAGEVKNPRRDYPRALFISVLIILSTLILGSLAIAMVVPQAKLDLASGLMESFSIFFDAYHLQWMVPIIAILIILGGFGTVSAWVIGPTKGVMIAADDGSAPRFLAATNARKVPTVVLITQGIIFTILSSLFIFMPNINTAFGLLSQMTGEIAILVYLLLFATAIRLRYKQPDTPRKYRVPGGNLGMWLVAGSGMLLAAFVFILGLFPPSQLAVGSIFTYETILIGGIIIICLPVLFKK